MLGDNKNPMRSGKIQPFIRMVAADILAIVFLYWQ
jgi:hypothetical protein